MPDVISLDLFESGIKQVLKLDLPLNTLHYPPADTSGWKKTFKTATQRPGLIVVAADLPDYDPEVL